MAYDNKTILRDAANQPIPQVYDDQTDAYQPATGTDGKQHVIPHNPDGSPADFRGLSTEATLLALSAKIDTLQAAVEAQAKGTDADPATTVLSGSNQDLRGKAADKPAADSVPAGTTYWSVDEVPMLVEVSDGATWEPV